MDKRLKHSIFLYPFILTLSFFVVTDLFGMDFEELKKEVLKKEDEINSINKEIDVKRKRIEVLEDEKLSLINEIDNIDRVLEREERKLRRIEREWKEVEVDIKEIKADLMNLREKKKGLEDSLEGRLAAIFKMRQGGVLRVLFSTENLNDLGRNLRYIRALVNYDTLLLEAYRENQIRLEDGRKRLNNRKSELETLSKEYKTKRERLFHQRDKRHSIIERIRKEETLQLAVVRELEVVALELQSLIDSLRGEIEGVDIGFASMRGRLDMPVDGKIVSFFGKIKHPKFKTITFNKGIEIMASVGTEVSTVFKGEVVYSGWFKGYGIMMIIDHGGGYYTLLAHLSKILKNEGDTVDKGDVVALVGDTGSLKGPILYFEVRFHGDPKDPLDWVAKR